MPSKYTTSVSLIEHLSRFIEAQITSGRFRSTSEVVRAGLRLLERDQAGLPPTRGDGPSAAAVGGDDSSPASQSQP